MNQQAYNQSVNRRKYLSKIVTVIKTNEDVKVIGINYDNKGNVETLTTVGAERVAEIYKESEITINKS